MVLGWLLCCGCCCNLICCFWMLVLDWFGWLFGFVLLLGVCADCLFISDLVLLCVWFQVVLVFGLWLCILDLLVCLL